MFFFFYLIKPYFLLFIILVLIFFLFVLWTFYFFIYLQIFIYFIFYLIEDIFLLKFNKDFRKDFLLDLIFYRIFPHKFYDNYTQMNINYIYYPSFYFLQLDYLFYKTSTDQYFDLLNEIDTLDNSSEVSSVRNYVLKRVQKLQVDRFEIVVDEIFFYLNTMFVYSQLTERDNDMFNHYQKLEGMFKPFIKFNDVTKQNWTYKWKHFIKDDIQKYHENTGPLEHYRFDEKYLFPYFPKSVNPVIYFKSMRLPRFKEFLKTDYAIMLKDDKDIKKLLNGYTSYKEFMKFLSSYNSGLSKIYDFHNRKHLDSSYLTFMDSVNTNFHFSNFLFFSHIYLQTWEHMDHEREVDVFKYVIWLDIFPDRFYLYILFMLYLFFIYYLWIISSSFFFWLFFLFSNWLILIFSFLIFILIIIK